jgi:pyrimidine-nucleoside phosphorylase
MRMVDIIMKKRSGESLSQEEMNWWIKGYVEGIIPDYQVSALLMAIYFQGLDKQEKFYLTDAMKNSGEVIDLSSIDGIKVDKHSTGGVGDKTSLVVAPLAASFGIKMAKMSGRGLGHTGGTLDKLESIPGFSVEETTEEFFEQVKKIGLAIIGQTKDITPADKKLYALRDVTATVESEGLIASSIMSKKLASGADHIVLDVKVGAGAFMKDVESATSLAKTMVEIGQDFGRDTIATLTSMNQPLGNAVGNSLEVIEAIETLKGNGPEDFTELCLQLTGEILRVAKLAQTQEQAYEMAKTHIEDGSGLQKLRDMISMQKGDPRVVDQYDLFASAKTRVSLVYVEKDAAYVEKLNALLVGEAAMVLGAGRCVKEDKIDPAVGIVLNKKIGDKVENGEVLAYVYTNDKNTDEALRLLKEAYQMVKHPVQKESIILGVVDKTSINR